MLLLLVDYSACKADWINMTGAENSRNIAEIYIDEDRVKVNLEVYVGDLFHFEELIPDEMFPEPIQGRPEITERLASFGREKLQIITESGDKIIPTLLLAEPKLRVNRPSPMVGKINPYTRRIIPGPPEDKRVLYAELSYPITENIKKLTIVPPTDEKGYVKASLGFICYHLGVPVVDFRNMTAENVLTLNWDDPWYSTFEKKQLRRTLQSGVRTYLYIEPYEVRHEVLVRVKDMMAWMEFDLKGREYIETDEFNRVREQVADFFMKRENVLIDGKKLSPILDRTSYVESSSQRSRFIDIPEKVPLNTAMIGVVITYLTEGVPREVSTEWNLFSDNVQKVAAIMTDPAGPFPYSLTPDDNILHWKNFLKKYTIPTVQRIDVLDDHRGFPVPLLSVLCFVLLLSFAPLFVSKRNSGKTSKKYLVLMIALGIGVFALIPFIQVPFGNTARASQIGDDDSKEIIQSILKNIYRAFDFREESDVYDKLAISVSGNLLNEIYLQNRKSMVIEQAGGAQAKVKEVEVLSTQLDRSKTQKGSLDVKTSWSATGLVGHWGHIHTRQNVYKAILTMSVVEDSWKITGIELLEEYRVDPMASSPQQELSNKYLSGGDR